MNSYCKECIHRDIPSFLKEKFNKIIHDTFIECPTNDKKVASCFINTCIIDWEKFIEYCIKEEVLSDKEIKRLKKEGCYGRKRGSN